MLRAAWPVAGAAALLAGAACAETPPGRAPAPAAADPAAPADAVAPADLMAHVRVLAGDDHEGRGAGYPGEARAAEYIAARFREIGLRPVIGGAGGGAAFIQTFPFHPRGPERFGQTLESRNVIGYLEGSDPGLRREIVVLGAHHDGQGRDGQADAGRYPAPDGDDDVPGASGPRPPDVIWNSADDNASSVAVLIEVARVLASRRGAGTMAARPRRSILFVTFGAEEHAVNGSSHYIAAPPFPLARHVAMVNLEKLGRVPGQPLAAAAVSTSPAWRSILAAASEATGLPVDPIIPDLIMDTDHYGFALRGVPAITVGTAHEEDTHRPTDEADRLDPETMARRARFVLAVLRDLADRDAPPPFQADGAPDPGVLALAASPLELRALGGTGGPGAGAGAGPAGALKVGAVIAGRAAHRADLRPGDFVVAIDGRRLDQDAGKETLKEAFQAASGPLDLTVVRGSRRLRISLAPDPPAAPPAGP